MVRECFLQGRSDVGVSLQGGVMSFPADRLAEIVEALERYADRFREGPGEELFAVQGLARKVRRA